MVALLSSLAVLDVFANDHLGKCQHSIEKAEARLERFAITANVLPSGGAAARIKPQSGTMLE